MDTGASVLGVDHPGQGVGSTPTPLQIAQKLRINSYIPLLPSIPWETLFIYIYHNIEWAKPRELLAKRRTLEKKQVFDVNL